MPEENDKKELDADDIVIDETENIEDTPKAEIEEILSDLLWSTHPGSCAFHLGEC